MLQTSFTEPLCISLSFRCTIVDSSYAERSEVLSEASVSTFIWVLFTYSEYDLRRNNVDDFRMQADDFMTVRSNFVQHSTKFMCPAYNICVHSGICVHSRAFDFYPRPKRDPGST